MRNNSAAYAYLADNLRDIRRYRGMSQTELCNATGLGQTYLSDLELGRHPRDYAEVQNIAHALSVPVEMLLARESPTRGGKTIPQFITDGDVAIEPMVRRRQRKSMLSA